MVFYVVRKLDSNKAHGNHQISIHMLQIRHKAIFKPLYLIFSSCIELGIFPTKWKMTNMVPIHKRDDKQDVKNYQPVSLLPIFGKIFERCIYNAMYSLVMENELISPKQSEFKQGDFCINRLLSIVHDIYQSSGQDYEVHDFFTYFKGIWQGQT